MNKKGLIIVAVVALVLAGGALILSQSNKPRSVVNGPATDATITGNTDNANTQNENTQEAIRQTPPENANIITYSNDGFAPGTLTVKAGSTVTITNNSSRILQFNSHPHPEHTDNNELNVGNISPGQSKSITVTKTGSHGYHNHANDDHTGTLIVE